MPQVSDLKDRIYQLTNNTYNDNFHMLNLLNDALNQLTDGAKLEGVQTINVVSGTDSYDLPATFKAPIALVDGSISAPNQVFDLVTIDDNNAGYVIFAGKMHLKPTINEDKTLTLYFYKYATPLVSDTDVPEIDAQYHDLLATYAAAMIMLLPAMKEYDKGLADRLLGRWEDGKKSFKESMMRKGKRTSVARRTVW